MYQIELKKEQIVKNFNYFYDCNRSYMSIYPKGDMEQYFQYLKHTLFNNGVILDDMKYIFPLEDSQICEFEDIISYTIVFEFPDEETAFYFKLKFC